MRFFANNDDVVLSSLCIKLQELLSEEQQISDAKLM